MKSRTHFTHRIDMWDNDGENVIEHLAGVEDFEVAMATYRAACKRWPNAAAAPMTLFGHLRAAEQQRNPPASFDHLVGDGEQRNREGEAEIDDQLDLCGLLGRGASAAG